ncbi:MAG: hypothetical protein HY606_13100 [Planctomycetes bacterium]|nr:hypothetical protein [Planctomycetota bacterium]
MNTYIDEINQSVGDTQRSLKIKPLIDSTLKEIYSCCISPKPYFTCTNNDIEIIYRNGQWI